MQLSLVRYLGLLFLLGISWAAPQPQGSNKQEQLVRVYRIDEKQYERMLKLTEGKNVISEARLISGGFATVSESLSSGWHSLLRIVGLTTISKADEEAKLDIDGQPLCVIKTREGEGQFREDTSARSSGKSYDVDEVDEEPIHCIVVLNNGHEQEQELPSVEYSPNFSNYWSTPQVQEPQYASGQDLNEPAKMEVVQQPVVEQDEKKTQDQSAEKQHEQEKEEEQQEEELEEEVTTEAPPKPKLAKKKKHKSGHSKTNTHSKSPSNDLSSRQFSPYQYPQYSAPPPPSPQYGIYNPYPFVQQQFGGLPPYGFYNPQLTSPYGPYPPQSYQPYNFPFGLYRPYDPSNNENHDDDDNDNDDDDDDNLYNDSSYEVVAEPEIIYNVERDNHWGYDNE
ncbi:uncharacterized protein [Drosophila tropicalis]|uniref:uncharacterized protein n=1 Tax=Drosophila tropicalis TaxID=46794 RepID=UPI0035ABE99A